MSRTLLYLHIGVNKTGTTAIQRFLNSRREDFISSGILYPKAGTIGEAHYSISDALGFGHTKLSRDCRLEQQRRIKKMLREEVQCTKPKCIVISSEFFTLNGDIGTVQNFFSEYDVRIVVYLRRHDDWWPSNYSQAVQHTTNPKWRGWGLEKYIAYHQKHNPNNGNWRYLVDRWADCFGRDSMIVRPYEKIQNKPNLMADFLSSISMGNLAPEEFPAINQSLDAWSLRMIDVAQRANIGEDIRRRIIAYTKLNQLSGNKLHYPSSFLNQLISRHSEDYSYIAKEYLKRKDGMLFFNPIHEIDSEIILNKLPNLAEVMAWTALALSENDIKT